MRFNNSYELANYFVKKNNDTRQWGELRGFEKSNTWRYYFWDMRDKYVRGKPIMEQFFSTEYREAEEKCISNFIDYIDKRLTFPLDYKCVCTDCDGHSTYFDVTFTIDNQLTFDMSMT